MSFASDPAPGDVRLSVVSGDLTPSLYAALLASAVVACDLETSGLDKHRDRIGTIQFHTEDIGAVVVQISGSAPTRCLQLLETPAVVKVFHHAPFDLGFLRVAWPVRATNVRCTKIASKLAHPESTPEQHSLGPLLRRHLGVSLDKGAVRTSDWLSPQLTPEQLRYAADDTRYLVPLLAHLTAELTTTTAGLFVRCCEFLPVQAELAAAGHEDIFSY